MLVIGYVFLCVFFSKFSNNLEKEDVFNTEDIKRTREDLNNFLERIGI